MDALSAPHPCSLQAGAGVKELPAAGGGSMRADDHLVRDLPIGPYARLRTPPCCH
jgi:hypothetical protein